jgi:hypothetical protein
LNKGAAIILFIKNTYAKQVKIDAPEGLARAYVL